MIGSDGFSLAADYPAAGRGELRAGAHADVTVIDPASLAGQATYAEPLRPATGVRHVLVGGVPVLEDSRPTGARPGRVLLRA